MRENANRAGLSQRVATHQDGKVKFDVTVKRHVVERVMDRFDLLDPEDIKQFITKILYGGIYLETENGVEIRYRDAKLTGVREGSRIVIRTVLPSPGGDSKRPQTLHSDFGIRNFEVREISFPPRWRQWVDSLVLGYRMSTWTWTSGRPRCLVHAQKSVRF